MRTYKYFSILIVLVAFSTTSALAQIPERRLDNARALVEQKKHNEAIEEYLKIRKWLEKDPGLLIEMARVYTYANRHAEAIVLFESIGKDHPAKAKELKKELANQHAYVALSRARALVEKKKYAEAIKEYNALGDWLKRDPGLILEYARVYAYNNKHDEAIALYEKALSGKPKNAKVITKELDNQKSFINLTKARKLVEEQKYDEAIKAYDLLGDWLERDPGLILERARAHSYADRHQQAIEIYEEAIKKQPEKGKASEELKDQKAFVRLRQARELVRQKKYDEAIKVYDELGDWLKRDPGLVAERARVYSYANKHKEAIKIYEQAIKYQPKKVDVQTDLALEVSNQKAFLRLDAARKMVEKNHYKEALVIYDELSDLLKRDSGLIVEHARVYSYANDHEEALRVFASAIALDPELSKTLKKEIKDQEMFIQLEAARTLVEQEKYDEAVELYERIDGLLKRDPGLVIEKGRVYSYANRHAEAAKIFESVISENKEHTTIFVRELGDMYAWMHYFDKAISIYTSALETNPEDVDSRLSLAHALAWKGEIKAAHVEYDTVLAKDPSSIPGLLGKADVYTMQDRLGTAGNLLDKVQELEPGNIDALNMRARIMVWQGYHRKGIALYKEILELYPRNIEALEGLAFGLHWADRDPEAFDVVEKIFIIKPSRTEARKLMAKIRNARRPNAEVYGSYTDDSNPRTTVEYGVTVDSLVTDYLNLKGRYGRRNIQEKDDLNEDLDIDIYGLSSELHFTRNIILDLDLALADVDQTDWQELFVDASLLWHPLDVIKLDVGYERDTVNSIDAITDELIEESVNARIKWRPDRMWLFSAKQEYGEYSDDNKKETTLLIGEYRVKQTPYLKLYYNYYRGEWDEDVDGYFSPLAFYSQTLGAYLSKRFSPRHFGYIQASLGQEHHGEGAHVHVPNAYVAGGYVYRLRDNWKLQANASYFDSDSDEDRNHDGYRETYVWASISRSFGGYIGKDIEPEIQPTPVPENR